MRRVVSFAIMPINKLTRKKLGKGEVLFNVNGQTINPVYKNDGYFVFTDLPEGNYSVRVHGLQFQQEIAEVNFTPGKPPEVIILPLSPSEQYVHKENTTQIKGKLLYKDKKPVANAIYNAIPKSQGILKITEKEAKAGSKFLKVYSTVPKNKIPIPGKFLLKHREDNNCEIITVLKADGNICILEKPLENDWIRSVEIIEVIYGRTFEDGYFYLIIDNEKFDAQCKLEMTFTVGKDSFKNQVSINKSGFNDLGEIVFNPKGDF